MQKPSGNSDFVPDQSQVMMASNENSENVLFTNIPLDNNPSLRGFFRKATRLIDKVNTLKNSHRSGVSIGNVEIAIQ
jgi:hypothetical protein